MLKACLLVLNALAVLHRERFLRTWGIAELDSSLPATSLKNQAAGFLNAVSYMKVPLIAMNVLVMTVELLFGGGARTDRRRPQNSKLRR